MVFHRLAVAFDRGGSIGRIGARAIRWERAAVAVAIQISAGQWRKRTTGCCRDDRRKLRLPRELIEAAEDEAMPLVLGGRSFFGMRIEPDRQSLQIVRVASASVVHHNERALEIGGRVLGLRKRVRDEELIIVGEPLVQRERKAFVPGLTERGVLKDRGGSKGDAIDVVRPPIGAEGWNDRVVVDCTDLMMSANVQGVCRHRDHRPEGAVVADGSLLRIWSLQARIGRDHQARVWGGRLGKLVSRHSPRRDRAREPQDQRAHAVSRSIDSVADLRVRQDLIVVEDPPRGVDRRSPVPAGIE